MLGLMKSTVQYDATELRASMKVKHDNTTGEAALAEGRFSGGTNVVLGVSGPGNR